MSDTDADEGDETAKALSLVSPSVVNSQFFNARPIIDLSSSKTEIDSFYVSIVCNFLNPL